MIRFTHLKLTALALGAAALTASGTLLMAAPASADTADYDGYCYVKKTKDDQKDALIGAAVGGAAGAIFGKKGKKAKSAAIGAAVGGVAGYVIGKNSKEKVVCDGDRYYVYSKAYYDPNPAERGYRLVFFEDRPEGVDLYVRYKGKDVPYSPH